MKSKRWILLLTIGLSACTGPITHTELASGKPSAQMRFELLTADFAGGGHVGFSPDTACRKSLRVSDYVRISDFRKGHTFRDDVDQFEATLPAGKEIQLFGRSHAPRFKCDTSVVFTPEPGANYLVTFEYKLPHIGCKLSVYNISTGVQQAVPPEHCRD